MIRRMKMAAMVLVVSVSFTGCCWLSGTCKETPPDGPTLVNDALVTIFKQKSKTVSAVTSAQSKLYDKKNNLTKDGAVIQKKYNDAAAESDAFVNFIISKLTMRSSGDRIFN